MKGHFLTRLLLRQGAQIIGANRCAGNISACAPPLKQFWVEYGHEMVRLLDALPARHGAYLHNCQSHCQTGPGMWTTDTVNGTHMGRAVAAWYAAALAGEQASVPRSVDRCDWCRAPPTSAPCFRCQRQNGGTGPRPVPFAVGFVCDVIRIEDG